MIVLISETIRKNDSIAQKDKNKNKKHTHESEPYIATARQCDQVVMQSTVILAATALQVTSQNYLIKFQVQNNSIPTHKHRSLRKVCPTPLW